MYIKIDDKNKVIMQIVDKFAEGLEADNVTTFRTASDSLPLEKDEVLYYDPETDIYRVEKIEYTKEQIANAKALNEARAKKTKALQWLTDNDWKVNKRMLGEWAEDDERWAAYLADRAKARAEIDEAEATLNELSK